MNNFKLETLVKHMRQLYIRQGIICLIILLLAFWQTDLEGVFDWTMGCIWGMLDMTLMLMAIKKGMEKTPEEALALMQRNMYERVALGVFLSITLLKLDFSIFQLLTTFLILHISLIMNLIIIAIRNPR